MSSYNIAIPTHRRADLFEQKTLAQLRASNVSLGQVMLFLSDDEDAEAYWRFGLPMCVTGAASLTEKFNTIHNAYLPGSQVVVMEDDIELVEAVTPGKNGVRPLADLVGLIEAGFASLDGRGIWGIAPHSNAFYMTGKVSRTLKLVVAHCFGFVATRNPALQVTQPSKTDYERTLRYFVEYGETVRLDWVGVKTKSYTQPGGLQSELTRDARTLAEQTACDYLVAHWPHLIEHNRSKQSLFAELKFKRCTMGRDELRSFQSALERSRAQ